MITQETRRSLGEVALEGIGKDRAIGRVFWLVALRREIPPRHRHIRAEILQRLFKFIEIDAMPWQEPLPAMLAMVLMDEGQVVVGTLVADPLVQLVEFAEGMAQPLLLRFAQHIDVHALPQFALGIAPGC